MKKLFAILLTISLLCTSAFGAVGYKKDGVPVASASTIDIEGGFSEFDGSTVTIYTSGMKDGVTTNASGETNLDSAALAYGVILIADMGALDASDARYIALANGTAGQVIQIQIVADTGGTLYITDDKVSSDVLTMTNTGWDDIAFNSALDSVTLLFVDTTYGWIIIGANSVTVT